MEATSGTAQLAMSIENTKVERSESWAQKMEWEEKAAEEIGHRAEDLKEESFWNGLIGGIGAIGTLAMLL